MTAPKEAIKDGKKTHFSVGAIIERDGKVLMMDRRQIPLGFACPAGHIDVGQTPEMALKREVKEETGLDVKKHALLIEDDYEGSGCTRGVKMHHWYVYKVDVSGDLVKDRREAKSMEWYSWEEVQDLNLEPAWRHWFKLLKDQ